MYYLIKQEKHLFCNDDGEVTFFNKTAPNDITVTQCPTPECKNGYIEARIDADKWLLERLNELNTKPPLKLWMISSERDYVELPNGGCETRPVWDSFKEFDNAEHAIEWIKANPRTSVSVQFLWSCSECGSPDGGALCKWHIEDFENRKQFRYGGK